MKGETNRFALSQLVDIPHLFHRLDALPQELATARQELCAANIQAGEAGTDYDEAQERAYRECAHPGSVPVGPLPPNAALKKAFGYLTAWEEERSACMANLADLNDEMSALRAKVDLVTALTLGRQETTESVLLRRLLEMVRSVPGQVEETILETEEALGAEKPSRVYEAGISVPFEGGDPVPF